jgi:hypothetical protein
VTDTLEALSRDELAGLAREYLLAGHLIDRAGMPFVMAEFGRDAMRDVAIDEWMGASPVYTRRMRRALRFEGDDVATIFKGMQFDIGAPHQFMDFRFRVIDATHGEFSLAWCGALMDVEPFGEELVVAMCHHIEDPTFDATASATNPRARMRPVHRPPRVPAGRVPHCNWTVEIDQNAEPLSEPEGATWLATSRAANVELATPPEAAPDGDTDYTGEMDPDLLFERFSHATLVRICDELCLQGQLLARSFMRAVEVRFGTEAAVRIGARQLIGIAGVTAKRLGRLLGTAGGPGDIARILELHPAFRPRAYVNATIDGPTIVLGPCDGLAEGDELTWPALLLREGTPALQAMVQAVDGNAVCSRESPGRHVGAAWFVRIAENGPGAPDSDEVRVTSFSKGAAFEFANKEGSRTAPAKQAE